MIFAFNFFPFKADFHSVNVSYMILHDFDIEVNKMFYLPNKLLLFTNRKQPLKCVQQNSYVDL